MRELAAQATRDSILKAAIKVFAKHGYDGGSVEKISKAAKSYDRMIYYYFGSKEGLFIAALEEIYRRFNEAESQLVLDDHPMQALTQVVHFIVRYYRESPEFVTLLNSENLYRGKHIGKSLRAREYSPPAIRILDQLLKRGIDEGLMRSDLSGRDLYLMVAALGYFYQSNRFTLSAFLGENLESPGAFAHWESFVVDTVLRTVSPVQELALAT
ncbi:TetR/AcrR family transcriptional regulator [Aquabacterium sp. J223]|uniref:TetR/AcrR family transcriptional regulator n=1 Tax=Aquabacterium sp. J223 TaxID=2898431 RepID=UPI0021ADBC7F|nr:TetR/AcrR family transcriptional regulator [Aquabacterium sp. J223]UUX95196.1 TetR family transcriptional regulator [Aquabacterium sp. J223]